MVTGNVCLLEGFFFEAFRTMATFCVKSQKCGNVLRLVRISSFRVLLIYFLIFIQIKASVKVSMFFVS